TCTATSGNGAWTGTQRLFIRQRRLSREILSMTSRPRIVSCAAVAGAATPGTAVPRTVSGTCRPTAIPTTVSACPHFLSLKPGQQEKLAERRRRGRTARSGVQAAAGAQRSGAAAEWPERSWLTGVPGAPTPRLARHPSRPARLPTTGADRRPLSLNADH